MKSNNSYYMKEEITNRKVLILKFKGVKIKKVSTQNTIKSIKKFKKISLKNILKKN